ncbi:MAG: SEC-C domain-containing protein [Proteobacteria bacterium]|nr:SEC-C domain-containing protein [Pseudomonadota bacterium]
MINCPCGSKKEFAECCGLYLEEKKAAKTPEALMRSRYSAYTKADIAYIKRTMRKNALINFNEKEAYLWTQSVKWEKLEVINSYLDSQNENLGYVEFKAYFLLQEKRQIMHELSQFEFEEGQWFYVDGERPPKTPTVKISRNAPCPCNSQKKFKNCHGKS